MTTQAEEKQRTSQQNRAMHKYFTDLANELNAAGVDQKLFIDHLKGWEVPITADFLKQIWKIKQEKMFGTTSTTQLNTHHVTQVYETVNKFVGQAFGIHTAFPTQEELDQKFSNLED